ncbi:hypothetical protein [Paenibacillus sinopodophylli]|uniref:hypothetical protein n=1 Tax=Paenibacillus sinopodophylli TaxID=1837342 RepID=UPI00110CD0E4|nr:hypothetical protein [Paenibacillus sinopodophylli]
MKNDFDRSIEIYNPNGKAFIPFFVELLIKLRKEVVFIIDEDLPVEEGTPLKHAAAITHFLKEFEAKSEIKLVIHTPDLEGFYNIDLEQIGELLGMSNRVRRSKKGCLNFLAAFFSVTKKIKSG